jgi:uncharacterized protein (DUF2236 family)
VTAASPDPLHGFYGPDSMMWRINREAVLLGAGPAALLLQLAHPHVAEGVAHHSTFEDDPFRRLRGTLRTSLAMVFGDAAESRAAVGRLNRIHRDVRGDALDPEARATVGDAYRAMDPALLLWVQVTLVVTSVTAYERWVGALTDVEKERFWQEARSVGVRLGIGLAYSPHTWPALMTYWDGMLGPDGPIHVTPTARRLSRTVVRPPLRRVPPALVDLGALPGLALLPQRLREEYGVPWGPMRDHLATWVTRALRLWVAVIPAGARALPQARAAERRVRRGVRHARRTGTLSATQR